MMQSNGQPRPIAVGNEAQLHQALEDGAARIDLRDEIVVSQSLHITGSVTLDGRRYPIRRGPGFTGSLLVVEPGGSLMLQSVTVDGHRARSAPGEPLLLVDGGAAQLGCGAVLQNNHTLGPGGAVLVRTGPGRTSEFRMLADSMIRNCRSEAAGGAVAAVFADSVARGFVRVAGSCRICDNKAMSGGGVAAWHGPGGQGLVLIEGSCRIENNIAALYGGGVSYENTGGAEAKPVALRIGGTVCLEGNRAVSGGGGGVCLRAATAADRVIVGERAQICGNAARQGGGVCVYGSGDSGFLHSGGTVDRNRAEEAGQDIFTSAIKP